MLPAGGCVGATLHWSCNSESHQVNAGLDDTKPDAEDGEGFPHFTLESQTSIRGMMSNQYLHLEC